MIIAEGEQIVPRSVSVEHNQGAVVLKFFRGAELGFLDVVVPAGAVAALMRDVTHHGTQALTFVAEAWHRGDCPECKNVRLVDAVGVAGRTTSVYCERCVRPGPATTGYPRVYAIEERSA